MANNLKDHLKEVADAIRAKKGTSDLINPQNFATEIEGISGGGESNITYYRYDRDNALAILGDRSTETALFLYADMLAGLDITGITPSGSLMSFAGAIYTVCQDALEGINTRIPLSYCATTPNTIMGKHGQTLAGQVTNMHDFIRLVGKEMMQWSEEQTNAAVALFTEISEEEFYASITA